MSTRARLVIALVGVFASMGASSRTTNFVVQAPTPQIAQLVGQWAEHYRREKALQWLGQEMPAWSRPCPLYVQVTMDGPSGATSFNFGQGTVLDMKMEIQGPLDRLIASVLPHEITHTVFAHYFRCPVPRWADEGGSVLSEDDIERERHDKLVRQILNSSQQIRLRTLFGLREYPQKVMCLYAQGYSMANYLVERSNRKTYLGFVAYGMQYGWDPAVKSYYGHKSVEELEEAWLQHLRDTKGQPHIQLAQNQQRAAPANPASQTVVRMTVPPSQAQQPAPIIRGQMPEQEQVGQRFGTAAVMAIPTGQVGYLPEYQQAAQAQQPYQPYQPVPVQLGPPQFGPMPGVPVQAVPTVSSPAGFPR